jgi:hypothetical protein
VAARMLSLPRFMWETWMSCNRPENGDAEPFPSLDRHHTTVHAALMDKSLSMGGVVNTTHWLLS